MIARSRSNSRYLPRRGFISKPRVASAVSAPWDVPMAEIYPEVVGSPFPTGRCNPFGVNPPEPFLPRVAAAQQPWALRCNPFGVGKSERFPIHCHQEVEPERRMLHAHFVSFHLMDLIHLIRGVCGERMRRILTSKSACKPAPEVSRIAPESGRRDSAAPAPAAAIRSKPPASVGMRTTS